MEAGGTTGVRNGRVFFPRHSAFSQNEIPFVFSNLNGKFFPTEVKNPRGNFWYYWPILKQVKIMIRPKAVKEHFQIYST